MVAVYDNDYTVCMTTDDPRDFKVLAFFPADHAAVENGKLYVNGGGWQQVRFPGYPQVIPWTALVALLEVPFTSMGAEHRLSIGNEDRDGAPLPLKAEVKFRVGAPATMDYGDPSVMPIALPLPNLVIPAAGSYTFTLAIDGKEAARFRIVAMQVAVPLQFSLIPPGQGSEPPQAEAG